MAYKVYLSPSNQSANTFKDKKYNEYTFWHGVFTPVLKAELESRGYEVMVNSANETLATRAAKAKTWGANIYVALHSNASASGNVRGAYYYYCNTKTDSDARKRLAECFRDKMKALNIFTTSIITLGNNLIDCKTPSMPSIICETGFHDNLSDCELIEGTYKAYAKAYADAIDEYFSVSVGTVKENVTEGDDNSLKTMLIYLLQCICVCCGTLPSKAYVDGDWGSQSKTAWASVMKKYSLS